MLRGSRTIAGSTCGSSHDAGQTRSGQVSKSGLPHASACTTVHLAAPEHAHFVGDVADVLPSQHELVEPQEQQAGDVLGVGIVDRPIQSRQHAVHLQLDWGV